MTEGTEVAAQKEGQQDHHIKSEEDLVNDDMQQMQINSKKPQVCDNAQGALEENIKEEEEQEEAQERDGPICFIENIDGEFHVTEEAKKMLVKVKGKIVIVCVAGPYRTGKSFLLNKLIHRGKESGSSSGSSSSNKNNGLVSNAAPITAVVALKSEKRQVEVESGFKVGASIRACTKGIWVWGKPIEKEGKSYLFLDTEGLGSTEQSLPYDTKIFALSLLLSSFFILNTPGTINEHILSELELVIQCAKKVKMYESAEKEEEEEEEDSEKENHDTRLNKGREMYENIFPSFLWVLRDFALKLVDEDDRPIAPSQYLESCLQQQPSQNKKTDNKNKNRTRETIKTVFTQRDCRTLVRPVYEEEMLQSLQKVSVNELRPEFLKQLDSLATFIFASARPKQINGSLVNGAALVGLAEAYVRAMNSGHLPVIHSAWEGVVLSQAAQGMESAMNVFVSRFNLSCPPETVVEQETLAEAYSIAEKEALLTLQDVCVGDEQSNRETQISLLNKLADIKRAREAENGELSLLLCKQVLSDVWKDDPEIKDSEFTHALASAKQQYYAKARGPNKEETWRAFFEQKLLWFCDVLAEKIARIILQCEELQAKKDEISELHSEAVKIAEEQSVISERLEGELEELREEHSSLLKSSQATELLRQQQLSGLAQERDRLYSEFQQTKAVLVETERTKQHYITKQEKSKERIATLTNELQCEREKLSILTHKYQDLSAEQQNHKQQLETMEASCRAVTAEGLRQQTLASASHSQERLQLSTSLEAQVALAQQQYDQISRLQEQVSQLESEKTQREGEVAVLEANQLQEQKSQGRFVDSNTFASLFFCLFVIVLSALFGFGPSWLV